MDDGIVDAAAAEGATVQQFPLRFPIGREDVEGQRAGTGAHEGNDLIQRFIRQHRQDGAEYLLLHDGGIRRDVGKQRRLDEAARVVVAAAEDDVLVFQQAQEAAVVLFGDDGGHVRIVAGGEKLLQCGAERLDKGLLDGLVDEQVVRLHAGLSGVQYLAKGDAAGGELDIRRCIDDDRAFAAQFQGHGRQVSGGGLHHHFANGDGTGEEDIIEFLLQQSAVLGATALDHGDIPRIERLAQHPGDDRRSGGRVGRGLDHRAVAGGNGPHQGREAQLDGIIPRREDERHAVRLRGDEAAGVELRQRRGHAALLHPAAQAL